MKKFVVFSLPRSGRYFLLNNLLANGVSCEALSDLADTSIERTESVLFKHNGTKDEFPGREVIVITRHPMFQMVSNFEYNVHNGAHEHSREQWESFLSVWIPEWKAFWEQHSPTISFDQIMDETGSVIERFTGEQAKVILSPHMKRVIETFQFYDKDRFDEIESQIAWKL